MPLPGQTPLPGKDFASEKVAKRTSRTSVPAFVANGLKQKVVMLQAENILLKKQLERTR